MHYTLTPRGNSVLIALMAIALLGCFVLGESPAPVVIAVFAVGGAIAGFLQKKALNRDAQKFQNASTAREVRAVLISSVTGKASIMLLWLAGISLIFLIVLGRGSVSVQTVVGAYAVFSLAREIVALPALFNLKRGHG